MKKKIVNFDKKNKTLKWGLDSSLQVKKTSTTAVYTYHSNNPGAFSSAFSKHK